MFYPDKNFHVCMVVCISTLLCLKTYPSNPTGDNTDIIFMCIHKNVSLALSLKSGVRIIHRGGLYMWDYGTYNIIPHYFQYLSKRIVRFPFFTI